MEKGFTLIELAVTIVIIGVLTAIAISSYRTWVKKTTIENDTKQIFALLNEARARAFAEKRQCGLIFNNRIVRLVCDTDLDNSILDETSSINEVILKNDFSKNFSYALFNKNGTASISGTIYADDISTDPNYSCVTISTTRIKMGKWNGSTCSLK